VLGHRVDLVQGCGRVDLEDLREPLRTGPSCTDVRSILSAECSESEEGEPFKTLIKRKVL
jgi:hypothetical protein